MLVFYLLLLTLAKAQVDEEDIQRAHHQYANALTHDGVKRVIAVDESNIQQLLKKNRLVYILFWVDNKQAGEKITDKDMNLLEVNAQFFQKDGVKFCTCEIMSNQKFAMSVEVKYTGMIKIFNYGKPHTYSGQRSIDVLIPYIKKMLESSGNIISSRSEKKTYDAIDLPKVIAYFDKESKEFEEYHKASLYFHPMVLFYVVHDSKLAKSFHLKKKNVIQLIKPHEKSVTFPAKEKITEQSLVRFLNENKKQRLTKMLLENIHEIWAIDMEGYAVPIFAIKNTEDGKAFLSMGKALSKYFEKNNNLSFIWIDPELFPTMHDYWEKTFDMNPSRPAIGVVDIHKQESTWFKSDDEEELVSQLPSIKKWLEKVAGGKIPLEKMKEYTPPPKKTLQDEDEIHEEL